MQRVQKTQAELKGITVDSNDVCDLSYKMLESVDTNKATEVDGIHY